MQFLWWVRLFDPISIDVGTVLDDRYEVLEFLGRGGVAVVVKAADRQAENAEVALKIFSPRFAEDEQILARFRNEVSIQSQLKHPNIVQVYSLGVTSEGVYFIIMEYVAGKTLYEKLYVERKKFQLLEILFILDQVAQALACAHNNGVVHRDLKPENILLTQDGTVKITDFGFAAVFDLEQRFTVSGLRVGTPYYMSPEQLRNEDPDPRMDLYALGLLGAELALGRHPYQSELREDENLALEVIRRVMEQPLPRMVSPDNDIPLWFEKMMRKCAAKEKERRYQSVVEFLHEFRAFLPEVQKLELPPVAEVFRRVPARKKKENIVQRLLGKVFSPKTEA